MAKVIRHFICKLKGCGGDTPFDLKEIVKPKQNFIICSKCGQRWDVTVIPSCCKVDLLFVSSSLINGKPISTIQSFSKGS